MADTGQVLIIVLLFVLVIFAGVFFVVKIYDSDYSSNTGTSSDNYNSPNVVVVEDYDDSRIPQLIPIINKKHRRHHRYHDDDSSCLASFFSCILSCTSGYQSQGAYEGDCIDRCEDDLDYECRNPRILLYEEDISDIRRLNCLEECRDYNSYIIPCSQACLY